jgi:hypothetical protein
MMQLGEPYSKDEIMAALSAETDAVHTFFAEIDHGATDRSPLQQSSFFTAPAGVWSPAENLVHLIKSSAPVVMALKLPKIALRLRFGKAKMPSRTLAVVRAMYTEVAVAGDAVATGDYVPEVDDFSAESRTRILSKWQSKSAELVAVTGKWSEHDLDKYVLPHPLLGTMTVREILFFTLYHNLHHVNDVQRLLDLPETEWFEPVSR